MIALLTLVSALTVGYPNARTAAPADPNYCKSGRCRDYQEAHSFNLFKDLTEAQSRMLAAYEPIASQAVKIGLDFAYLAWTDSHDYHAAAFLAVTHALEAFRFDLGNGTEIRATELLLRINRLEGDRIRVKLDTAKFDAWRNAGGRYQLEKADGKIETGDFKFKAGTSWGSSLHKGYDIQAASSVSKAPRLQINYRFSDAEADIDLDGYAPFVGGFIPNPRHLTYENSDPRQWFEKLVGKFGDPGFRVRPH